jgi:hypothetical protein
MVRGKFTFCSTNNFLRIKISIPALPDFNAGMLFFKPSFYQLPTLRLFNNRTSWQICHGRKKMWVMIRPLGEGATLPDFRQNHGAFLLAGLRIIRRQPAAVPSPSGRWSG